MILPPLETSNLNSRRLSQAGVATDVHKPHEQNEYYDQSPLFGYNSDTMQNRSAQRSNDAEESKGVKRGKTPRSLNGEEEEGKFERRESLDAFDREILVTSDPPTGSEKVDTIPTDRPSTGKEDGRHSDNLLKK